MRGPIILLVAFSFVLTTAWWIRGSSERELTDREAALGVDFRAGDLVFQDLACGLRCDLIRDVTNSRYSHVGFVDVDEDGARVVWEALTNVEAVPLATFVRRGGFAIYRPSAALASRHEQIREAIHAMRGRPYDADYQWDEGAIYCSELIAKGIRDALGEDLFVPHSVELGRHANRVHELSGGRLTERTLLVSPADLARSEHYALVVDEL